MAEITPIDLGDVAGDGGGEGLRDGGVKINANIANLNAELIATTALAGTAVQPAGLGELALLDEADLPATTADFRGSGAETMQAAFAAVAGGAITSLFLDEQAAAAADQAGRGQIWVKNTTPCELWFTDDVGTDSKIGGVDAGDIGVDTYGNYVAASVQNSLEALDDAVSQIETTADLTNSDITAATHEPARGFRYGYSNATRAVIMLGDTMVEPALCQLKKLSGAGDVLIAPKSGYTINGSNRVSGSQDAVSDAVFTGASGATISITSAGSNLTDRDAGQIVLVGSHDAQATNNGLYLVGSTHTTASLALTKLEGGNPVNASAEAITIDLIDPLTLVSLATVSMDGTDFTVDGGTDEDKSFDGSELTNATLGTGMVIPEVLMIACSDEATDLTTGTAKVTFRMPFAMTLNAGSAGVRANVNTAPAGSTIIVDINEGGTTILSTKLSIDATEETSVTATSAAVISDPALADDAEITIDIDQIGSGTAGKGLKVTLIGTRTLA